MIFEVADDEWVHTSIMSGLAPVKSQDEIVGVARRVRSVALPDALGRGARRRSRRCAAPAYKARERDELIDEFRENNHAIEAIDTMEAALGADGAPHRSSSPNDMIATVDDPVLGTTTQVGVPIHLAGTPGAIQGPRPEPGQHNDEIFGDARLLADDEIRPFTTSAQEVR